MSVSPAISALRARTLLAVALATLALACGPADPRDLARNNPWELGRELGRFIEVNGLDLFAISVGSGPDVVLVHGMIDSTVTWRSVIPRLVADHRVHAIDLPGFGFSEKPADSDYETSWLAEHLIGYLDAVGVDRAVLVGASMGGYVVTEAAILHPERVAALVLLEASGLPGDAPTEEPESVPEDSWAVSLLRLPLGQAIVRALPTRGLLRESLEPAYFLPSDLGEERLAAWHAPILTDNGMAAYLARSGRAIPSNRAARVAEISAPTLVITGKTNRMVGVRAAESYAELIPRSELAIWDDTGHMIQEQHPARVAAQIRRWTARHR